MACSSFEMARRNWPEHGVLGLLLEEGLVVAPKGSETRFLENQASIDLCLRMTTTFLTALAHRNPKYAVLVLPTVY